MLANEADSKREHYINEKLQLENILQ